MLIYFMEPLKIVKLKYGKMGLAITNGKRDVILNNSMTWIYIRNINIYYNKQYLCWMRSHFTMAKSISRKPLQLLSLCFISYYINIRLLTRLKACSVFYLGVKVTLYNFHAMLNTFSYPPISSSHKSCFTSFRGIRYV